MKERDDFFAPQHNRLLNIATWAKYLAWVILVVYSLWAISTYFQEQSYFLYYRGSSGLIYHDFMDLLKKSPSYGLSIFMEVVGVFLTGVIYFLVLKGISLGLNIIVETDINYREQREVQSE